MAYTEETYPFLVMEIMEYINEVKEQEHDMPLIEIITDFGRKHNIEPELIGDAITDDVYFKSFIEKDCQYHNIFKNENNPDDW